MGSAIVRAGFAQGFGDLAAVTVKDALVADTIINEFAGGVGGLGPGAVGSRPPIDVPVGKEYREGRIFRSEASLELSSAAIPQIVVTVFNRESPAKTGGFEGDLEIALLVVAEVHHQRLKDDEASLDGLLHHIESYLSLKRHQLLSENAYGGGALTKRLKGFSLNGVGTDPATDDTVFKTFQASVLYEVTQQQWLNPPVRI